MALRDRARRDWHRTAPRGHHCLRFDALESRQLLAVSIAEYPTQLVGAQPTAITAGSDGNLWFTQAQGGGIGSINPATHVIQAYPGTGGLSITSGPDGKLWVTDGGVASFDPRTHVFSQFALPGGGQALSITTGADGNLWFTIFPDVAPFQDTLGRINPTTHVIDEFAVPIMTGNGPDTTENITSGTDGNLWITSFSTDAIVSFNPITHAIAQYPVPYHIFSTPQGGGPGAHDGLNGITTGPDGDLWFTETLANRVGRINPTTHVIDEFFLPSPSSYPTGITPGAGDSVWFTEAGRQNANLDNQFQDIPIGASAIASISTTTGAISTYRTPSVNTNPIGITLGPDGHLWFTEEQADQIGEAIVHPDDGPQVLSVQRLGVHAQSTTLVLSFNTALDPASATDLANYAIVGPNRRPVAIASAVYDQALNTVTLTPASRLNVHWNYTLTVTGTPPHGIRDIYGTLLDGAGDGAPGSDYRATITWRNLVIGRDVPRMSRFAIAAPRPAHASVTARGHR